MKRAWSNEQSRRMTAVLTIIAVLLSLACVGQAVAWVQTNKIIGAQGVAVQATVPYGIYVSNEQNVPGTITTDKLGEYGFSGNAAVQSTYKLSPASTMDAVDFYAANRVLSSGQAATSTDRATYRLITDQEASGFYLDETMYVVNTFTADVTLVLSDVAITTGSRTADQNSNLYKAVRVAVTCGGTTQMYRVAEDGVATPVTGPDTVADMEDDPARDAGEQGNDVQSVDLSKAVAVDEKTLSNMTLTVVPITIKIWIEGENQYANAAFAGKNFRVTLTFTQSNS